MGWVTEVKGISGVGVGEQIGLYERRAPEGGNSRFYDSDSRDLSEFFSFSFTREKHKFAHFIFYFFIYPFILSASDDPLMKTYACDPNWNPRNKFPYQITYFRTEGLILI